MKYYWLLIAFLFAAGCAEDDPSEDKKDTWFHVGSDSPKENDSRHSGDTVIRIGIGMKDSTAADSAYPVEFHFTYIRQYCGGARPNEEILKEMQTPKALTSSEVTLKNHFNGQSYTCVIGADGSAGMTLPEGKYDVYLTRKVNTVTGFDPKCTQWLNKVMTTVKVTRDVKTRDVQLEFECNPCDDQMKMRP